MREILPWAAAAAMSNLLLGAPPPTKRVEHSENLHGVRISDPYRWLEAETPETRSWVVDQSKYAKDYLAKLPGRDALADRVKQLTAVARVPGGRGEAHAIRAGGRLFFERQDPGQNQPVLFVQSGSGPAAVLIDPNQASAAGISAISTWNPSPDGKLLAYGTSVAGSDWQLIRIREVDTGRDRADRIEWTKFSLGRWDRDSAGFYYSRYPQVPEDQLLTAANDHQQIYHHKLGTPQSADRLIYGRPDQRDWRFTAYPTESGHLLIQVGWGTRRQNRLIYIAPGNAKPVDLVADFHAQFEPIGHMGSVVYFETSDNAPLGRVIAIDLAKPERSNWREVVPQAKDALERATMQGSRILCQYMRDAKSVLSVHDAAKGKLDHEVTLPGIGSAAWGYESFVHSADSSDANSLYYYFLSFTRPAGLYRYDPVSRKSEPMVDGKLPFDPNAFETKQIFYRSKDGTRVPMYLIHKKGLELNGANPVLLYGYGGFNVPTLPSYSPRNLAWVEMGGVYAVANIRGGNEYGKDWHRNGALDKKQNVFDDFIAAAEWLIANKYTNPKRLAINGGSNGGLLVGACVNQRPDLFAAAIPSVGVMDMLRFHKFTVGMGWTSDYGNPDDPKDFQVLLKYSPLHNIKRGTQYPATLIMTADHDDRVVPLHSFKYGAMLQWAQEGPAPILLRIETDAGHGGGKPVSKTVEEAADVLAFLRHTLKM